MIKRKDLYEKLCKNYEFMLGTIPNRDELKQALRQTLSEEDIKVIFLLPFHGEIPMVKLEKKAAKIGIPPERVHDIVKRLVPEGFISSYIKPPDSAESGTAYLLHAPLGDMRHERRVVAIGDVVSMTEMQVRKHGDSPMLRASAVYFNAIPKLIATLLWLPLLKTYPRDMAAVRQKLSERREEIISQQEL